MNKLDELIRDPSIDWARPNYVLAEEHGTTIYNISRARRVIGVPAAIKWKHFRHWEWSNRKIATYKRVSLAAVRNARHVYARHRS